MLLCKLEVNRHNAILLLDGAVQRFPIANGRFLSLIGLFVVSAPSPSFLRNCAPSQQFTAIIEQPARAGRHCSRNRVTAAISTRRIDSNSPCFWL